MSEFVEVNVRFIAEDLLEYRQLALQERKSLSTYIRDILRAYAAHKRQRKATGT